MNTEQRNTFKLIQGHEKVLALFGQWPSFHDGEVLRMVLDRSGADQGLMTPTLELSLRGWVTGPEVNEDGFYRQHNDSVVCILFEGVEDLELEGFNHQNVISSLNLNHTEADAQGQGQEQVRLHVELEHCYLFSCELTAARATVLDIRPFKTPLPSHTERPAESG